jgi:hypothetical protein
MMLPMVVLGALSLAEISNAKKIKKTGMGLETGMILLALASFVTPAYFSFRAFNAQILPVWTQINNARDFDNMLVDALKAGWRPHIQIGKSQFYPAPKN